MITPLLHDHNNTVGRTHVADVVAFASKDGIRHVLLETRSSSPFKGRLALPGDRLQPGESSRAAAARVLSDRTGIKVQEHLLSYVGTWDTPGRDLRGTYISDAYVVTLPQLPSPKSGDSSALQWTPLSEAHRALLAQDHNDMIFAADSGPGPA